MELAEISRNLENISLPAEQKKAMLTLIDTKINDDMKEVIAEMRHMEARLEAKIQINNDKIQMVHDKLSNEIKVVYWVIGIAYAVMLFVVARK